MRATSLQACSIAFAFFLFSTPAIGHELTTHELRTESGIHLPIYKRKTSLQKRGGSSASIGLGDYVDVAYNVLVNIGGVASPVVLDTGSSDLWVISDACTGCSRAVQLYPQATFQSVGLQAQLLYGDSQTGTHAYGLIGKDTVDLAGLTLKDQFFAAINNTNTSVEDTGSAGIFGLGFPVNSVIWTTIFLNERQTGVQVGKRELADTDFSRPIFPDLSKLYNTVGSHLRRARFPNVANLYPGSKSKHGARQTVDPNVAFSQKVAESYTRTAPLLARLAATKALSLPQFTITLQRDAVQVGGNNGLLSIGELPAGVTNDSLTWVPLRAYTVDEGGLPAPPDSPKEAYPITWEVYMDDVYLDGVKLPKSTLSSPTIALSALVDTGNSLLRGPSDVVRAINAKLGSNFPCDQAHTLSFSIGGKLFPVDPRDFITQTYVDHVDVCNANLVSTDPPSEGAYLYSWSLGDPFLKSVVASYHYGNLTHPSHDPPKMGFLSTVPADAAAQLKAAVAAAKSGDGNFPAVSEDAPSGIRTSTPSAKSTGTSKDSKGNTASRTDSTPWTILTAALLVAFCAALTM
ncbi:hypothetical protein DXG01_011413 [Tephrocybe rancida]|nr:hypothetical protein DXG01_011413 [Tephrocybe rancida]